MTTTENRPRTIDDYLVLPSTVQVRHDGDGYFSRVIDLPGCMTWTERAEEPAPMIEAATRAWIECALEHGDVVP